MSNTERRFTENECILKSDYINELKNLCIKYVPTWDKLNYDSLELKVNTLAVTNQVYNLKPKNTDKYPYPIRRVLMKKTSKFNSSIVDSETLFQVCKLVGDHNCGPKVLAREGEYMIQEWVDGTYMKNEFFHNISTLTSMASSVAKFHKKVTGVAPSHWDRTPLVTKQTSIWSKDVERMVKKVNFGFDFTQLMYYMDLYTELLESNMKLYDTLANKVMFCHNDLFFSNVLNVQHGIYLIDFDYSWFNYAGFDIAVFFNKMQESVVKESSDSFYINKSLELSYDMKCLFASVYLSEFTGVNILPRDEIVRNFLNSVEIHSLGTHLFWLFWAIVM